MERAVTTLRRNKVIYDFWKYNQEATYQLNLSKMTLQLRDYLNSTNSQPVFIKGSTWGMSALLDTGMFIMDLYKKENRIEHRCIRAVMEHKKLMYMRISYLLSSDIWDDQEYLTCAYNALHLAEVAHFLGIKFRLTGGQNLAYKINDIIQKIVALEKSHLPDVFSDIEHNYSLVNNKYTTT